MEEKGTLPNSFPEASITLIQKPKTLDFPGGTVVKNLPTNVGDTGSSPGLGRSHMPQSN